MRLNMDCVRDILLCVEKHTGLRKYCYFIDSGLEGGAAFLDSVEQPRDYQETLSKKYENDELIYHIRFCLDAGLILGVQNCDGYKIGIADLTPAGHELLAKIRDDKQWGTLKRGLIAIRNYSLSAISALAEGVTSAAITSYVSGQSGRS